MHNVILIGMPGVGKSTLGVLLAKTLGMTFLDTDLVIQDQKKALLRELIAQHGIDGFLALEGTVCAGLQAENAVIATGGSVVYEPEAMAHLREIGIPLYETYAHITVDCGGQDIEHTLDRVLRALEKAQPKKNASL